MSGDPENTEKTGKIIDSRNKVLRGNEKCSRSNDINNENVEESIPKQNKVKFNKRLVAKLSIINCFVAIITIALGIVVSLESYDMPYWVAKSAFCLWFGFLILLTASAGGFAIMKPTSLARSRIQALLNLLVFILTVMSLAFYGKAAAFYKQLIDEKKYPSCKGPMTNHAVNSSKAYEICLEESKSKGIALCSIFSVLIVVSLVELVVSFLLLKLLRKALYFCFNWCNVEDNDHMISEPYAMYISGCSYAPSFGGATCLDYRIDARPLNALTCPKKTTPMKKTVKFVNIRCQEHLNRNNRPAFLTMESIDEGLEAHSNEVDETLSSKRQEKCGEILRFLPTKPEMK